MEEFMSDVIKALEMKLGEGYRIFPKEQRKNNELVLYGICIHKENESISPVVYPEEFILPYIVGILNAEKIADILLEQCRQREISQEAAAHLDDFGLMKDKVRIAPHSFLPEYLDDSIPEEREAGLAFGLSVLRLSKAIIVCGSRISSGMQGEIKMAGELDIINVTINHAAPHAGEKGNFYDLHRSI